MPHQDQTEFGKDFTDHSIADILNQLEQEIKDRGTWSDFFQGSVGKNLLETIAIYIAKHRFLQVRGVQEAFPTKAKRRSSVLEGFKILDFEPERRTMSKGDLRFFLDSPHDRDIVIPRLTVVQGEQSEIPFFTTQKVILSEGDTEVTVEAKQGEINEIVQTSQGQAFLEIEIPSDIVAEEGVEVYVDEDGDGFDPDDLWTEVDSLIQAVADSDQYEAYEISSEVDETLITQFGDGVQGKVPPSGSDILVRYFDTLGPDGVVTRTDEITNLQDEITDIGGTVVDINVTNDDRNMTGGSERQDLEDIKFQAPRLFSVGDAAVTRKDYQIIARDEPSILLANAVGERNEDPPNPEYADVVELHILRERDENGDPQPVTDEFLGLSGEGTLENPNEGSFLWEMKQKTMLNAVNRVFETGLVWFFVEGQAYIDPSETPSVVKSDIEDQLDEFLLAENNTDRNIGNSLRESDMKEVVGHVREVDYHHFKFRMYARHNMTSTSVDLTLTDFQVQNDSYQIAPPIKPFSVEIYDSTDTLIVTDDGKGNLVEEDAVSSEFNSGTINYDPAEDETFIEMTLNGEPNQVWEFQFYTDDPEIEQLEDGDILVNNRQYAIFDESKTSDNINMNLNFKEK